MQHEFQLANEIVFVEQVRPVEVINIVDLNQKLLSFFESIFYLEILDELGIQRILDHFRLAYLHPFIANQIIKNKVLLLLVLVQNC